VQNLINNLVSIVGHDNVLSSPDELLVYECDGLPHHKHRPLAVVFPTSSEQTSAVMKELARAKVPFTPRGAGTGLSGGALALNSGVVVEMARMRRILKIDPVNRLAVVQPGVVNLHVSRAVAQYGLYYVPDPSSQPTCTIGGNIAESAGGIHCLKYGTTTDHVLACKVVLAGGEVVTIGNAGLYKSGYDLIGVFVGSEGTFGIVTEATLKLVDSPPAVRTLLAEFAEVNDASHAVSAIIAAGVMPAALEMMDREIIRAVEASVFAAGLPPDAGAALLIELDGVEAGIDDETNRITSICMEYGARNCRRARDEAERKKLWAARKGAFGAIGRISPDSMIQDAVVPRSRLPEVLGAAYEIAARHQLRIANVFHAGDGNLHPLICFDSRFEDQVTRVKEAGRELMEVCVGAGGTITGEHGVGLDKRELLPLVFSETDMETMLKVRRAFDPLGLCNPGKIIPMLRGCGEGNAIASANGSAKSDQVLPQHPESPAIVNRTEFKVDVAQDKLGAIVGPDKVQHRSDSIVVHPAATEEVSETLRLAFANGWTVRAEGGGLRPDKVGPESNIIISTSRLNQIVEYEPADLIAIAQSGITLRDFNSTLNTSGQWLPLDPPDNGAATLGGIVATGVAGCQQLAYGRPRGMVAGMEVVLADGSVINVGGRVVKNVAGYDLSKLFTGSFGTLGVITKLNFKLRPRPIREATVVAAGQPTALLIAGQSVINARLFPVAVELVSSSLSNLIGIETDEKNAILLIRFAGNEKAVEWQLNTALNSLRDHEATSVSDDTTLWQSLALQPVNEQRGWTMSVPPGELNRVFDDVSTIYAESFQRKLWQIGVGTGIFRVLGETSNNIDALKTATNVGGLFSENFMHEIPPVLASKIKQQLDPTNVLPSELLAY
jgi:D-lactate dehydrogenase (cytochrome)